MGESGQSFRDDLAAYALGALDAERRREVEARLEGDPELRAELEEMQEAAASLALLAPSEEPPRSLKARLLERFDMELRARRTVGAPLPPPAPSLWARLKRRAMSPRLAYAVPAAVVAAVAASAASMVVFNAVVGQRIDEIQEQLTSEPVEQEVTAATLQETEAKIEERTAIQVEEVKAELDKKTESKLEAAQQELDSLRRTVSYQTKLMQLINREGAAYTWLAGEAEAAEATAVLAANRTGEPAVLWVNGLPQPPEGKRYQLWLYYQGRIWSPGTFTVETNGSAWIQLYLPLAVSNPMYARVTVEPVGGSSSPTGPDVLTPRR
jgi:anti-sigma-K factor RskA